MIRPARFGSNPETADSNRFQHADTQADDVVAAVREFDALARRLADAGVEVIVAEDSPEPVKPDACFPNNWVSFHADGSVVLYPMMAPSRRAERRREPIAAVERAGYRVARTIDLSHSKRATSSSREPAASCWTGRGGSPTPAVRREPPPARWRSSRRRSVIASFPSMRSARAAVRRTTPTC